MSDSSILWVHGSNLLHEFPDIEVIDNSDILVMHKTAAGTRVWRSTDTARNTVVFLPLVTPSRIEDDTQILHSVRVVATLSDGATVDTIEVIQNDVGALRQSTVASAPAVITGGEKLDQTIRLSGSVRGPLVLRMQISLPEVQSSRITVLGAGLVTID